MKTLISIYCRGLGEIILKVNARNSIITSRIFSKREVNMPLLSFAYWGRLNTKPKWKRLMMETGKSELSSQYLMAITKRKNGLIKSNN